MGIVSPVESDRPDQAEQLRIDIVPMTGDVVPEGVEEIEELHYTIDTFSPEHFTSFSLQQLPEAQQTPTRKIVTIPITRPSVSVGATSAVNDSLNHNETSRSVVLPRPASEPIPPFQPTASLDRLARPLVLENNGIVRGTDSEAATSTRRQSTPIPPFQPTGSLPDSPQRMAQEGGETSVDEGDLPLAPFLLDNDERPVETEAEESNPFGELDDADVEGEADVESSREQEGSLGEPNRDLDTEQDIAPGLESEGETDREPNSIPNLELDSELDLETGSDPESGPDIELEGDSLSDPESDSDAVLDRDDEPLEDDAHEGSEEEGLTDESSTDPEESLEEVNAEDVDAEDAEDVTVEEVNAEDVDAEDAEAEDLDADALEVIADQQVYDQERQSFVAEGNALMTFRGALLRADRIQVNLRNRIAVAQGDAVLTRGDQIIRGDRLEYNLVQDQGLIFDAKGEVFLPQASSDFGANRSPTVDTAPEVPLSDRLAADQPVVTAASPGGLQIGFGVSGASGNRNQQGTTGGGVSRIRFEADEIEFTSDGWRATNVRLTNDPFSPPELEVRSRLVTFRRLDENRSELRARNPRLVFDQGLQVPLLRERAIFDNRDRNPAPFQIGFDQDERGGLFIERPFAIVANELASLTLTPQFFVQQAWENSDDSANPDDTNSVLDPDLYGLLGELDVQFDAKTALRGNMTLTSLDLNNASDDDLRGSVRLQRRILTSLGDHILTGEYSFRDRLFNGTLGFQTIQRSFGAVITSPTIPLGDSGVELTYQGGIQRVNATVASDRRADLFPEGSLTNRTTLTRYQVAANLRRNYFLWAGTPLPATRDEGLRYTPNPVVPFVAIAPSVRGVASFYSNGDNQPIVTGQVSLFGQFGHFSRRYFDYLGFNLTYRRSTEGSESPFNFDRVADREVVSGGLTVQLFGPIRVGIQTSISLDQDEEFDNRFTVEYSRRTYGIVLSYNPDREIGTIGLRISDFNWNGTPEPFGGSGVRTVEDGVVR